MTTKKTDEVRDNEVHFHVENSAKMRIKPFLPDRSAACILLTLLVIPALVAGCSKDAKRKDDRALRDPLVRRALAKERVGDVDSALKTLLKAVERRPQLSYAHLKLGELYEKYEKDYIRAIYHYQRYLELAPETEKRDHVLEWIRVARMRLVPSPAGEPPDAAGTIASLKKENALLEDEIAQLREEREKLQQELAKLQGRPVSQGTVSGGQTRPAQAAPQQGGAAMTYTVQPGDSLSRIAARLYSSSAKWRRIYEANKGTMVSPADLRVGQVLVIPPNVD